MGEAVSDIFDARGVAIAPGDTAIYGFGVGRSVAMAEAVVLGEPWPANAPKRLESPPRVSLTPSGRVRLRVVRRSYSSGEKPVVDVAPDRLVVLKPVGGLNPIPRAGFILPPSPLPTQDEEVRTTSTTTPKASAPASPPSCGSRNGGRTPPTAPSNSRICKGR